MVHVQVDSSNYVVEVANSLPEPKTGLKARARVYSLENKMLAEHEEKKDDASEPTDFFTLDLAPFLQENVALFKLELRDSVGKLVCDHFYWLGGETPDFRYFNKMRRPHINPSVPSDAVFGL